MDSVPRDVMFTIFDRLPYGSILRLGMVNRRLFELTSIDRVWKRIVDDHPYTRSDEFPTLKLKMRDYMVNKCFLCDERTTNPKSPKTHGLKICSYCPNKMIRSSRSYHVKLIRGNYIALESLSTFGMSEEDLEGLDHFKETRKTWPYNPDLYEFYPAMIRTKEVYGSISIALDYHLRAPIWGELNRKHKPIRELKSLITKNGGFTIDMVRNKNKTALMLEAYLKEANPDKAQQLVNDMHQIFKASRKKQLLEDIAESGRDIPEDYPEFLKYIEKGSPTPFQIFSAMERQEQPKRKRQKVERYAA
eukprot:TRINITY_DN4718_c0_g1_i1.p1 TRINITY_DN4718_c0_g1~~TRINITY_DN4718_c0_g1_i1.p1  ORF type:complete len:304 (+),score=56.18 TRINITY_DN4718_c0_g1_i1:90-1001(+)